MNRLLVRLAVGLLAFVLGVGCAVVLGGAGGGSLTPSAGWLLVTWRAFASALAGAGCFALAAKCEVRRRRGAESDVAYSLLLLCLGFFLTAAGLGMFLGVFIPA